MSIQNSLLEREYTSPRSSDSMAAESAFRADEHDAVWYIELGKPGRNRLSDYGAYVCNVYTSTDDEHSFDEHHSPKTPVHPNFDRLTNIEARGIAAYVKLVDMVHFGKPGQSDWKLDSRDSFAIPEQYK